MTAARCARPFAFSLIFVGPALAGDVILNEYNAVAPDEWLGNPDLEECEGPAGFACSTRTDTYFGRVIGNGGNWFELAVVADHVDMRGWRLYWEEINALKEGVIFLSDDAFWSDIRAGTIITFTELTAAEGGIDTDVSFDPCNGDWWINVNSFDATLVTTTETNVEGDGPGNFSVGNNDWRLTILDSSGAVVTPAAGEGAVDYTGTSVNNREILRLEIEPSTGVLPSGPYDDGTRSSCGSFNNWTNDLGCRTYQTFAALRAAIRAECDVCQAVALNEYNAVGDTLYLNGGTADLDEDGGLASDAFFGRVLANGGDWIELVILTDHLDVRGWTIDWLDAAGESGAITLSDDALWSDLRAGAIVTFIEWTTAEGGLDTDSSFDLDGGDRWINVNTFDTAFVAGTTSSAPEHVSGEFDVSENDWSIVIRDGDGAAVVAPTGEGSITFYQDDVSDTNIFRYEDDPTSATVALGLYDDAASLSTFGALNMWTACPSGAIVTQDFSTLPDANCGGEEPGVLGDIDGDGVVDAADLAALLAAWGFCPRPCAADLDGDGDVDAGDLAILLAAWTV